MNIPDLEMLKQELTGRLARVGFLRVQSEPDITGIPAEVTMLFESGYAVFLLVQNNPGGHIQFLERATACCEWMGRSLRMRASHGFQLDGYVVVVLPACPDDPLMQQAVTQFELSRQICRRHVLWPSVPAQEIGRQRPNWDNRLDRVTVLALPDTGPLLPSAPLETKTTPLVQNIEANLQGGKLSYREIARRLNAEL